MSDENVPMKMGDLVGATGSQDINLDEIEVDILIIGKNKNSLEQSASFLTRRGWPTTVITNLSNSIEYIAKHKPDFILISYSHPSPTVNRLPDLIVQTFNLECVGFTEGMDASSAAKLNNAKVKYKIPGQPSGPNLQRSLRKILAEKFNIGGSDEKSGPSNRSMNAGDDGGGIVKIRGSNNGESDDDTVIQKSGLGMGPGGSNRSEYGRGKGENDSSGVYEGSGGHSDNLGMQIQKGASNLSHSETQEGTSASSFSETQEGGSNLDHSELQAGDGKNESNRSRKKLKELTGAADLGQQASGNMLFGSDLETAPKQGKSYSDGKENVSYEGSAKKKAWSQQGGDLTGDAISHTKAKSGYTFDSGPAGSRGGPHDDSTSELDEQLKQSLLAELEPEDAESLPETNSVEDFKNQPIEMRVEAVIEAKLKEICQVEEGESPRIIQEVNEILVLPLRSSEFPGYIIVAWDEQSKSEKENFLGLMQEGIQTSLGEIGLSGLLNPGFWMKIPMLDFYQWASEHAKFQTTVAHGHSEVGVAFFPSDCPIFQPALAPEAKMYKIDIDEVSTKEKVNFNAYLYLPKNDRKLLYLKNGGRLSAKQKARLLKHNMEHFYLQEADLDNLRKYLGIAFINQKASGGKKAA